MSLKITVKLTRQRISPARLIRQTQTGSRSGAMVTFSGVVRGAEKGQPISALEYTCYEPMALKQMETIAKAAGARWPLHSVQIVHRTGRIKVGELSVFIIVQSAHRKEAFAACKYLIDRLKKVVPIWKAVPK